MQAIFSNTIDTATCALKSLKNGSFMEIEKNTHDKGGFNLVADYLLNDTNYYLRHAAAVPKQDRKPVRLFDKFLKKINGVT